MPPTTSVNIASSEFKANPFPFYSTHICAVKPLSIELSSRTKEMLGS
jgi:hypothetical protein